MGELHDADDTHSNSINGEVLSADQEVVGEKERTNWKQMISIFPNVKICSKQAVNPHGKEERSCTA